MNYRSTRGRFGVLVMLVLVLASLMALSSSALAQDELTETAAAEDGSFGVSYPAGWKVGVLDSKLIVSSFEAATAITFAGPNDAALSGATTVEEAIANFAAAGVLTPGEIAEMTVGERTFSVAPLNITSQAQWVVGIPLSDGRFVAAQVIAPAGTVLEESTAGAIVASVDVPAAAGGGGGACMVSTETADTAQLRVGPGTNRTVVAFLPANQEFNVLGEAKADDDSLWWKLDKAEAAPKSAAAEIWVAQDAVTATGDCANVGEAAAPAIVPITQPKPPTTTTTTTTGQAAAPAAPVVVASGKGLWITLPAWQAQLPVTARATSASTAKYLVSVNALITTLETTEYIKGNGEKTNVSRNRIDYQIIITVRETGQVVGQQTLLGTDPAGFPPTLSISGTLNGEPPKWEYARDWILGYAG